MKKLLTIGFLHYEDYKNLDTTLSYIKKKLSNIDQHHLRNIEFLISDNCSSNKLLIKKIYNKFFKYLNIRIIFTKKYSMVDYNIYNIISNSNSKYVWIYASDDSFCNKNILLNILNFLDSNKPDILVHSISVKPCNDNKLDYTQINLDNFGSIYQSLKSAGKISCSIFTTKYFNNNFLKQLRPFFGSGYLHISILTLIYDFGATSIYHSRNNLVFTRHSYKHKHQYHPKFSNSLHYSVASKKLINNVRRLKLMINNPLIFKFLWIITSIFKRNHYQWDVLMLNDYHNEIFYEYYSLPNIKFIESLLMIMSLFFLILGLKIKLFKSSIDGLLGKRVKCNYIYLNENKK